MSRIRSLAAALLVAWLTVPALARAQNTDTNSCTIRCPIAPKSAAGVASASAKTGKRAPARGRYRITLLGFNVIHQTLDDAFRLDGCDDEVRVRADVHMVDGKGEEVVPVTSFLTDVYGDVNNQNGRIQAGHCSPRGGLSTGDFVPTDAPWKLTGAMAARAAGDTDRGDDSDVAASGDSDDAEPNTDAAEKLTLPMVLYEGTLTRGGEAPVISAWIEEVDRGNNPLGDWAGWVSESVEKINEQPRVKAMFGPEGSAIISATGVAGSITQSFSADVLGQPGDRPIGMTKVGGSGATRGELAFTPRVLIVSQPMAEEYLKKSFKGQRGVFAMTFRDDARLQGEYALFLRVEKLP